VEKTKNKNKITNNIKISNAKTQNKNKQKSKYTQKNYIIIILQLFWQKSSFYTDMPCKSFQNF